MTTTNFNLRLEKSLKDRAFPVFERYGLSASQAFKLFLNQVAETNMIPLSFDYQAKEPNAVTKKAIFEALERTDFSDAMSLDDALKVLDDHA